MKRERMQRLVLFAAIAAAGCGDLSSDDLSVNEGAALGDRLPGIDSALFAEAKGAFDTVEGMADGVGPIFNERSCAGCHSNGADGGAGENIERRFGRFVGGFFDPLANLG